MTNAFGLQNYTRKVWASAQGRRFDVHLDVSVVHLVYKKSGREGKN